MHPSSLLPLAALPLALLACRAAEPRPAAAPGAPPGWEMDNPVRPLPPPPLGSGADFSLVPWVTPEKARLGRWLFFDARLGADGKVSCATCHVPAHGFSEPSPVSTGVGGRRGTRKALPILNAAFPIFPVWFWDGRAGSLVEQARAPIENPHEMASTHDLAVATVSGVAGYRPYFREAFGDPAVDIERISEAIAAYEATRLSGGSRYDRFDAGDESALGPAERHGRDLFFGRAGCVQCHLGPQLSDASFHNLGVGWREPPAGAPAIQGFADLGRYAVTGEPRDVGAFKTPTLREVSRRAPYMHDGSIADLREAVLHYVRGGVPNPWLSERVVPTPLSDAEVDALVAFLRALDGEGFLDRAPRSFPR